MLRPFFPSIDSVVFRDVWKPGAHSTIEKSFFTALYVTLTGRVCEHAKPGRQLYPFEGRLLEGVNYATCVPACIQ